MLSWGFSSAFRFAMATLKYSMNNLFSMSVVASRSKLLFSPTRLNESDSLPFLYFAKVFAPLPSSILVISFNGIILYRFFDFRSGTVISLGSRQQMNFSCKNICLGLGAPFWPYFTKVVPFIKNSNASPMFLRIYFSASIFWRFCSFSSNWRDSLIDWWSNPWLFPV